MNKTNKILKMKITNTVRQKYKLPRVCPSCSKTTFSFCHLVQHNPKSKTESHKNNSSLRVALQCI